MDGGEVARQTSLPLLQHRDDSLQLADDLRFPRRLVTETLDFSVEPVAVAEEVVQGRVGVRASAQPHGVRGHEGGVEVDVEREAAFGKALDPPKGRAHVDVGGLFEVVGRRGEEDIVRGDADIGDGLAAIHLAQVLEDLDARDQIPGATDRLGDGGDAAERFDVGADLADRVGGDVDAEGLHPAVAKGFDQQSLGAPEVEHPARLDLGHDPIGDGREEVHPLDLGAVVGDGPEGGLVVVPVVEGSCHVRARALVGRIHHASVGGGPARERR